MIFDGWWIRRKIVVFVELFYIVYDLAAMKQFVHGYNGTHIIKYKLFY